MRTFRPLLACAAALATTALGAAPAAAVVDHAQEHYDVTFTDRNLCGSGLTAEVHAAGTFTEVVRYTDSGAPLFFDNFVGSTSFTIGDRTVVARYAGPGRDLSLVLNDDGTITLTTLVTGRITTIDDASGTEVYRNTGRIVYERVIDLNGTPSDPEDDSLVSETVLATSGQGFEEDFCEVLLGLLTA